MNTDDGGLRYWHEVESEAAYIAHEAARVAALCARAGGHPESAPALERTLLTVAGIDPPSQRNDAQPDLFAA